MNSGSFFRLDLKTSKVMNGVTYFEYIDMPDVSEGEDKLVYPIRLNISYDRVIVFVHYYNDGDVDLPRHTEEVILDLPFAADKTKDLSSTIKRIYNTPFPLSSYLLKLLTERYIECGGKYRAIQESQINKDSYSSLFIWGLLDNQDSDISFYCIQDEKSRITKFLRKLLLDFMFDLMHSDVFESSKYYFQMREGLMSDFFFSAIVKKCEYYYYRRLVRSRFSIITDNANYILSKDKDRFKKKEICYASCQTEKIYRTDSFLVNRESISEKSLPDPHYYTFWSLVTRIKYRHQENVVWTENALKLHEGTDDNLETTNRSIKNLYAERLDEAESAWVETIMHPKADKHFSFSPEWFEDQERRDKKMNFSVSESWFVNPEEEMARIVFPLEDESKSDVSERVSLIKRLCYSMKENVRRLLFLEEPAKIHYLNSYELSELIGTKDNSSVLDRNSKISRWFYQRFDFRDTFRLHLFDNWNDFFIILLLAFSICALFPWFWECPGRIAIFPGVAAIASFISAAWFAICKSRRKIAQTIDDVLLCNRRKNECKKSFRIGMIMSLTWAFLILFDFGNTNIWLFALKVLLLLGGAGLLLFHYSPKTRIIENIHILLPRLVASITTAWITIVIGNDLFKEHISWHVCIIITIVVFAFILYEGNKSLPGISTKARIWRAAELMILSFSISLVIGIFAVDVLGPSLHTDMTEAIDRGYSAIVSSDIIPWHFLIGDVGLTITLFPKYLIQFSFLAMFIGVFIQMIFEEKNINEL